jgi:hypothetical protein
MTCTIPLHAKITHRELQPLHGTTPQVAAGFIIRSRIVISQS